MTAEERKIPLCYRCNHKATSHEVDDEALAACLECDCPGWENAPDGRSIYPAEVSQRLPIPVTECDECDGSGTYTIDGKPQACICSEPQQSLCSQCGVGIAVDEDGCCVTCGADAVGPGASAVVAALERVEKRCALFESLLREWRRTPFFEDPGDWEAWVRDFRPKVDEALGEDR